MSVVKRFCEWVGLVTECEPERIPVPGETWLGKSGDSPWPSKSNLIAEVLDVKEGWVRYSLGGGLLSDERMRVPQFIRIYSPKTEGE